MTTSPVDHAYAEAVAGWAALLRQGSTTTWREWVEHAAVEPGAAAPGGPVPTATHLELARRLNERRRGHVRFDPALVDLVLTTPAPGRGRVDVPLPWSGPGLPRFGQPPVDPADLPEEELLRLAVGVLARVLPGVPAPPPPADLTRWPMPWRRRFRLHGAPATVAGVRSALLAQGWVETDWRPVHLVLARPLEVMMAEHWAAGAAAGGHLRWHALWRRAEAVDALPARVDVVATAERLARAVDHRHAPVHLVLAREPREVVQQVVDVLGVRRFELDASVDPALVDLLRRLNRLTALTLGPARVRRSATTLADLLADPPDPSASPQQVRVPRAVAPWARRTAEASLRRAGERPERGRVGGYAVHGDPGVLVPSAPGPRSGASGAIDPGGTLQLALDGCLRAWQQRTPAPTAAQER